MGKIKYDRDVLLEAIDKVVKRTERMDMSWELYALSDFLITRFSHG